MANIIVCGSVKHVMDRKRVDLFFTASTINIYLGLDSETCSDTTFDD